MTMYGIIGAVMLGVGLVTLVGRFKAPDSQMFSKLQPMKDRWGDGPGTAVHVFAYTVMPIAAGLTVLVREFAGGQ
ncbi:MAG: hypothetical protein ACJAZO_004719 [Myxococcota bacterium]|jgi:hypothetical protein